MSLDISLLNRYSKHISKQSLYDLQIQYKQQYQHLHQCSFSQAIQLVLAGLVHYSWIYTWWQGITEPFFILLYVTLNINNLQRRWTVVEENNNSSSWAITGYYSTWHLHRNVHFTCTGSWEKYLGLFGLLNIWLLATSHWFTCAVFYFGLSSI